MAMTSTDQSCRKNGDAVHHLQHVTVDIHAEMAFLKTFCELPLTPETVDMSYSGTPHQRLTMEDE